MRVTSKGQVTIPQELREQFGLIPGTEVEFARDNGQLVVRRTDGMSRGEAAVASLRRHQRPGRMSTDEIMARSRGTD